MDVSKRWGFYVFAVVLNAGLLIFGAILIHQGAVHKISAGVAEVRDIIVERTTDPIWFWISVGFDAVIGASLVAGSFYGLWLTFRRTAPSDDPGDDT